MIIKEDSTSNKLLRKLKHAFILILICNSFFARSQVIHTKDLVKIFQMDSTHLQKYLEDGKYPYYKAYGDRYIQYQGINPYMFRIFSDSNKFYDKIYPMLFYQIDSINEFKEYVNILTTMGFSFDSTLTAKATIAIGDIINCYSLGNIEVQLSDNNFMDNIKMVANAAPMSAYAGQDIHMYSVLIRYKDYSKLK